MRTCGDCGVEPGQMHLDGCDVQRCPRCGHQAIGCDCIYEVNGVDPDDLEDGPTEAMYARWDAEWGRRYQPWTGEWPGDAEAREFGWYCRMTDRGWVRCSPDAPGAVPDLNRLATEARWDADVGRFVQRAGTRSIKSRED